MKKPRISLCWMNRAKKYQLLVMHSGEDIAAPHLFPECLVDLREVFENEEP